MRHCLPLVGMLVYVCQSCIKARGCRRAVSEGILHTTKRACSGWATISADLSTGVPCPAVALNACCKVIDPGAIGSSTWEPQPCHACCATHWLYGTLNIMLDHVADLWMSLSKLCGRSCTATPCYVWWVDRMGVLAWKSVHGLLPPKHTCT